jgi:hypothetical protein
MLNIWYVTVVTFHIISSGPECIHNGLNWIFYNWLITLQFYLRKWVSIARIHFYASPSGLTVFSQLLQCSKHSVRCTKYLGCMHVYWRIYVRIYVCTWDHTYVCICVSVEHIKDYFPSILTQTGSVKLSNFQRIVWCAVPYAVRASVWSWWPALRTNAHWRLSAHSGVFIWLTFLHVYVRGVFNAWKKLQEWVTRTKTGRIKKRIKVCPQTRRFQGLAPQRVDPRSPDISPLGFYLLGHKTLSVFSSNWK